ncbi:GEVED domain-containing protein [Flavobacterium pedocola]
MTFFTLLTNAQSVTDNFTATGAGTWTAPPGVNSITVEAWGGGGHGASSTGGNAGAGGGGGAYARKVIAVTPGVTYNLFVGAGGTSTTTDGGDSYFNNATIFLAVGGKGPATNAATGGAGGLATNCVADTAYNGGSGGNVVSGDSGGGGGGAGNANPGTSGSGTTAGTGGTTGGGNGGAGRTTNGSGSAGSTLAGGGGGARGANNGGNGARGELRITYTPPVPANDNCAAAIGLTVNSGLTCTTQTFGTTASATQSQAGCTGTADDDIWYSFVATSTSHTVTVTPTTLSNAVFQSFSGSCAGLTDLGCTNATTGFTAETATLSGLTIGNTYYVRVFSAANGSGQGTFNICITTPIANDNCSGATAITVNTNGSCTLTTSGTSVTATQSQAGCAGTADDDVWFSFVAANTAQDITVTPGTMSDVVFQVFSGTCGTLSSMGCIDATLGSSAESASATGLTVGATYYIRVYSYSNGTNQGTFTVCVTNPGYCSATSSVSTRYINSVQTIGNLTNMSNLNTGRAASGYADYTGLPTTTQIPGGGINVDYVLAVSRQFMKVWVDWNNSGTFTDAAPELVYTTGGVQTIAGSFGFVVPMGTAPGTYRMRIRTYETSQTFGPCGVLINGETEDYSVTVIADCPAKITSVTDGSRCEPGTVDLYAYGTAGTTQYRWYNALTGGALVGTSNTNLWTTPSISSTTTYYVAAFNGTCESLFREKVVATVNLSSVISVTPSTPEVCGENNVVSISATGDVMVEDLVNVTFNDGTFGSLVRQNVAADANTQWTVRTSPYIPTGAVWKPALTSRTVGDQFALSVSDFASPNPKDMILRTAVLNASVYTDLHLSFKHHFSYYAGEPSQWADIDVSTNGGGAWTTIQSYTSTQGYAGLFNEVTLDLSAYAGAPSLMVRFRYHLAGGSAWADGWAIDDVRLYGTRPMNTTFTWSGGSVNAFIDAACTIPYVAQSVSTVYVKPTGAQLTSPSWSFTATATLSNGCPVSKLITVNNKTKLWKGNVDGNWYNPNNWEPAGVPDANTCVFIYDGPFDSKINTAASNAFARTLTVRPNGDLQILSNNNLTVTDGVTVDASGIFNIENAGSLIQVNNVANSGNIFMKRNVNIRKLDYVYWSSPVANFGLNNVSPGTTGYKWKWTPTIPTNTNGFGNWLGTSETMTLGKGYIVRGPNAYTTTLQNYTATFTGVPNNGTITIPISRGTYNGANYATGVSTTPATKDDDNWNLIGNPYPSAIDANTFLANNTNIAGFIKLWTHGTLPSSAIADPFYENFVANYTVADYITFNYLGSLSPIFDGKIAAGQGFFVLMNHTSAATTENVTFTNTLRSNANRNDQFFRDSEGTSEKHRIWLDLISPSNAGSRTLVGYATGATHGKDHYYDAPALDVKTDFEIYSLIGDERFNIQGKGLPFDSADVIPLGIKAPTSGNYTIAIGTVDGMFAETTRKIYLLDKQLNVTHDLKVAPYSFTTNSGVNDNRFELHFTESTLGNNDVSELTNSVLVYTDSKLNIKSGMEPIKEIAVYDILGKLIVEKNDINDNNFTVNNLAPTMSTLVVKITLENGVVVSKKVIF